MRGLKYSIGIFMVAVPLLSTESVMAWVNNGFETDYFYTCAKNNKTKIHDESIRNADPEVGQLDDLLYEKSLTFAGKSTNDARFYGITPNGTWTSWFVHELNSAGTVLKEENVATLLGEPQLGTDLDITNIRYNPLGNSGAGSLVIPVKGDKTAAQAFNVYELDLELTTVLRTYNGPVTAADKKLGCDVDPATGTIYVAGGSDLGKFDPVTMAYSVLVAGTGNTPNNVIVRSPLGGLTQTTLVVTGVTSSANEYSLTGTFIKNHPAVVGSTASNMRYGQQDKINGDIYIGTFGDNHIFLNTDDTVDNWDQGANYFDAASPAPEPVTLALLGIGMLVLRRRRSV